MLEQEIQKIVEENKQKLEDALKLINTVPDDQKLKMINQLEWIGNISLIMEVLRNMDNLEEFINIRRYNDEEINTLKY